ncbi:MAG: hypothetical protein V1909_02605 [Candidatus Micrarchaeota archaeon]
MNTQQRQLIESLLARWRKISPECISRQPAEVQQFYNEQIKPLLSAEAGA